MNIKTDQFTLRQFVICWWEYFPVPPIIDFMFVNHYGNQVTNKWRGEEATSQKFSQISYPSDYDGKISSPATTIFRDLLKVPW